MTVVQLIDRLGRIVAQDPTAADMPVVFEDTHPAYGDEFEVDEVKIMGPTEPRWLAGKVGHRVMLNRTDGPPEAGDS